MGEPVKFVGLSVEEAQLIQRTLEADGATAETVSQNGSYYVSARFPDEIRPIRSILVTLKKIMVWIGAVAFIFFFISGSIIQYFYGPIQIDLSNPRTPWEYVPPSVAGSAGALLGLVSVFAIIVERVETALKGEPIESDLSGLEKFILRKVTNLPRVLVKKFVPNARTA
jgi:hypothetical protein